MSKRCKKQHKGMGHNRSLKRGVRDLKHRAKDIDQIYESLFKIRSHDNQIQDSSHEVDNKKSLYCQFCDRYFMDQNSMISHSKQKSHKRRIKSIKNYIPYDG
uniref:Matrin-type domain-containing protein n=1 Tax=Theileria annulata TaxID=5874 RepID=A0A3B0MYC1_THEAN